MNETSLNRWSGKSAEDVLAEALHQLRAPIHTAVGSLNVLRSAEAVQLSPEQTQQMIDLGLRSALRAKDVIDAISQYLAENYKSQ